MPRRREKFGKERFYHIFNKSKTGKTIFYFTKDYEKFFYQMLRFEEEFKEGGFAIKAFCIMPNHFHLLINPGTPEDIPLFMQKLEQGYAKYFNFKYSSPGTVWNGRYKVKEITDEKYLLTVIDYIQKNSEKHLNIPSKYRFRRSNINTENSSIEKILDQLDNYILEI